MTSASGSSAAGRGGWKLAALAAFGLTCWPGCATTKTLTINRDDYINSGMHVDRPLGDRTGEPLDVAVVLVYPSDLKNDANLRLKSDSGISCKEWYEKRPLPGDDPAAVGGNPRFRLKQSQIFLFTNDTQYYGQRVGPALNGVKVDPQAAVVNFDFKEGANDPHATIYVFGRFNGTEPGSVLAVAPAAFRKPGSYPKALAVRIGVDWNRTATSGQFIEVQTAPK